MSRVQALIDAFDRYCAAIGITDPEAKARVVCDVFVRKAETLRIRLQALAEQRIADARKGRHDDD